MDQPPPSQPLPPPSAESFPPPPPGGAPAPGSVPAAGSRPKRWPWVVVGALVLVVGAVVAVAVFGSSGDPTNTLEKLLPPALEKNFASQGIETRVSAVRCDKVAFEDGPFSANCVVSFTGASRTMTAVVSGSISGNTLRVTDASSPSRLLDAPSAVEATQNKVDGVAPGVKVLQCKLSESPLVMRDGDTFTCTTDSDETLTMKIVNGDSLEIASVR